MKSIMITTLILLSVSLSSIASAHSMLPVGNVDWAVGGDFHLKTYTLENKFNYPAVFKVEVFNKDWTPATGWKVKKDRFKLLPKSKANLRFKFIMESPQRKLIVCSSLAEIGVRNEKSTQISRICSRLIINSRNSFSE
tara:strand:+ start:672 stop:1085 length:414 start_codon:yes stop_codon:yes gene_type:complete